jgi:hypothetical protein
MEKKALARTGILSRILAFPQAMLIGIVGLLFSFAAQCQTSFSNSLAPSPSKELLSRLIFVWGTFGSALSEQPEASPPGFLFFYEAGLTDHIWSIAELVTMQELATKQLVSAKNE